MWLLSKLPPTRLCRGSAVLGLQSHLSPRRVPAALGCAGPKRRELLRPCCPHAQQPPASPSLTSGPRAFSEALLWILAWLGSAQPSLPVLLSLLCVPAALAHICLRHSSFRCFLPIFLISLGPFCVNFLCLLELTVPPSIASSAKFINV